ncbi:MAG: OmpA-OmpF porin, OOP family [Desulfobacteraceae bacterium Eth-SRB2]|nr:MAG: OmpA-OmpF porin, OOP family [Desulfobacteraceae bacterium Eth-SRB2]
MTKDYLRTVFLVMISALLFGCATGQVQTTQPLFSPDTLEADQYKPKVDNFMVILDKSSSMSYKYNGQKRLNIAKEFLSAMNQTLPDIKLNGALRTFGHMASASGKPSVLFYGPAEYSKKKFQGALDAAQRAMGRSPLGAAITAATGDLKKSEGQIAVIIVSDGADMDTTPITAAKNMKAKYGDRVCIYTVLVGDDPAGETLMKQVSAAGGCGFSVRADGVKDSGDMGNFVKNVFLAGMAKPMMAKPLDSDGDGVTDDLDRCPDTPRGVKVDGRGCPIDTDGDGVYDYLDKCPNTPKGATVDARGCWTYAAVVLFGFDSAEVKSEAFPMLDEAISILKKNSEMKVEIDGHTDNRGPAAYNMKLSERRAKSIMQYFVDKGVEAERLTTKGFGFTQPAASNETKEGRAKNRRVELTPVK